MSGARLDNQLYALCRARCDASRFIPHISAKTLTEMELNLEADEDIDGQFLSKGKYLKQYGFSAPLASFLNIVHKSYNTVVRVRSHLLLLSARIHN